MVKGRGFRVQGEREEVRGEEAGESFPLHKVILLLLLLLFHKESYPIKKKTATLLMKLIVIE